MDGEVEWKNWVDEERDRVSCGLRIEWEGVLEERKIGKKKKRMGCWTDCQCVEEKGRKVRERERFFFEESKI